MLFRQHQVRLYAVREVGRLLPVPPAAVVGVEALVAHESALLVKAMADGHGALFRGEEHMRTAYVLCAPLIFTHIEK